MHGLDVGARGQIGNRPRHAQDAVIGAGGQAEPLDRTVKQAVFDFAQRAVTFGFAIAEPGIRFTRSGQLPFACRADAFAHRRGGFSGMTGPQFSMIDPWYFELEIDTIEQGPGDPRTIAADLIGRTTTAPTGIASMAARTRVHCGDKLKSGRKVSLSRSPRNRDVTRFDWLAQHFENAAVIFGKFIKE